jgi:hypothetical protein
VNTTSGDTGSVRITWGASAGYDDAGTATSLFPRIKLKNGGWIALLQQTSLTNNTLYAIPGEYSVSDYTTGNELWDSANFGNDAGGGTTASQVDYGLSVGNVNYTIDIATANTSAILWGIDSDNDGTVDCNFNSTMGPAILFMEEKTLDASNGYGICIPLTTEGTTTKMPAISTPALTDGTGSLVSLASDTYSSQQVTKYGTLVERDTTDNNRVILKYPNDQMTVDILFASDEAVIVPGTSGSAEVTELGSVTVRDSEYSKIQSKNVVVVGGSCINSVAATLLGSSYCGPDFTSETGVESGQFLIQSFDNPDASGKVALLVAGYEAADTTNAVKYLTTEMPDTATGKKYKGTSATSATEVVADESSDDSMTDDSENETA